MSLLFFLRKLALHVLYPPVLLLLLALGGLLLTARPGRRRPGHVLASGSLLLLFALSLPVVADLFVRPLENVHPPSAYRQTPLDPGAIVVLGSGRWGGAPEEPTANLRATATARVGGGIRLAREHPDLPVAVGGMNSARAMAAYAESVGGIDPDRFLLLDRARTTGEEARHAAERLEARTVFLVTSALHMSRAAREFEKAGFQVVPVPVDFRQRGPDPNPLDYLPSAASWGVLQAAAHEYLGLLAGRLF